MKLISLVDKYFIKKPRIRKAVSLVLYGNKDREINFFNTRLYINALKENGYYRAARYAKKSSVFKDEVSALINLAGVLGDASAFIDVGANVGLFCSTVCRFQNMYPALEIYAFEANPDTFKRLERTAAGTGIKMYNCAVSNADKKLQFVQGAVSHVFAVQERANAYHYKKQKAVEVVAKRLDSFAFNGDKLVIKIDVEGHEPEVLEGAAGLLQERRVKAIFLDGYNRHSSVISLLQSYGFELYNGRTLQPLKDTDFSLLAILKDGHTL